MLVRAVSRPLTTSDQIRVMRLCQLLVVAMVWTFGVATAAPQQPGTGTMQRNDDISASTLERPIGTASQRQASHNRVHSVLGAWHAARTHGSMTE